MEELMSRATRLTLAAVLLTAGCGEAVPQQLQAESSRQAAASSHLTNSSDAPLTYSALDRSGNLTLAPGETVTGTGGAWLTPLGTVCIWHYADSANTHHTIAAATYPLWQIYTGLSQVIESCAALS